MMNKLLTMLFFASIITLNVNSQTNNNIDWKEVKIVGSQKIESEFLGVKDTMDWPVFNSSFLKLDKKVVTVEGYYHCYETLDMESLQMKTMCLIAAAPKPTIKISGIEQYRPNEFIILKDTIISDIKFGNKIKLKGILKINQGDESDGTLLSLLNAEIN